MEVKFCSTSNVELIDTMGGDYSIVDAAMVSTMSDATRVTEDQGRTEGFLHRLMRDRHGSPFEHVLFTFQVKTPLFTARQMMRHRIASFNETSGRYRVLDTEFYIPSEDRLLVQDGKPMDYNMKPGSYQQYLSMVASFKFIVTTAAAEYTFMLNQGVTKEVARMVLPVNVMTEFFVTINLRSLFNFLSLRGSKEGRVPSHPQYEITVVADAMEQFVEACVPVSMKVFNDNGRVAP